MSLMHWTLPWVCFFSFFLSFSSGRFYQVPQEKGTLLHCWWEWKLIQPLWRTVWRFLKKTRNKTTIWPRKPSLGIYPEKAIIERVTCIPMFIAALFTIARTGKQPRCPSTDGRMRWWYICTMEYYSTIKRNEIESVIVMWMSLQFVIQSEVSQKEKNKHCMLTHMYGISKNGTDEPICRARTETDS